MALGLAFATVVFGGRASVAAAKFDEGASSSQVAAATDPYLTDVFVRPGEALGGPDGTAALAGSTRPDDQAVRFSHSDGVPQPGLAGEGWAFEWDDALMLGIGGFVLVLGLGLALGYLRRPRLAGL
jgi:hypothetical protein